MDEERKSRLDSEDAAAQLNEQLGKVRKDQETSQSSAQKQYEKLQQQFQALQVRESLSASILTQQKCRSQARR